jgi:hypothetical protein
VAHREEGQAATFRTVVKEIITSKSSTPLLLGMCVWGERWGGGIVLPLLMVRQLLHEIRQESC